MSSGMSSKYGNVLDGYNLNKCPCIIYFWNPQAKCSLMVLMPDIMMTIRMQSRQQHILTCRNSQRLLYIPIESFVYSQIELIPDLFQLSNRPKQTMFDEIILWLTSLAVSGRGWRPPTKKNNHICVLGWEKLMPWLDYRLEIFRRSPAWVRYCHGHTGQNGCPVPRVAHGRTIIIISEHYRNISLNHCDIGLRSGHRTLLPTLYYIPFNLIVFIF